MSEPMLMIENSNVNVVSSPWNVRFTSSGSTTWKLKASVPTMAIMTSGIHRSGTRRTYARPARTMRLPRSATGAGRSSAGFIIQRATITAMYESPSSANAHDSRRWR